MRVTDPGLIVIEDYEALAAAHAAAAAAGASVHLRLEPLDEVELAQAELAQTALPCVVGSVHAELALPTRAVAKCHRAERQAIVKGAGADAAATTQTVGVIESGRRRRQRRRWGRSRSRKVVGGGLGSRRSVGSIAYIC